MSLCVIVLLFLQYVQCAVVVILSIQYFFINLKYYIVFQLQSVKKLFFLKTFTETTQFKASI